MSEPLRIHCPACNAHYDIPAASLGDAGRKVRCTQCKHVWFQQPVVEDSAPEVAIEDEQPIVRPVIPEVSAPPAANTLPVPHTPPRRLLAVAWTVLILLIGGSIGAGLAMRRTIVAAWEPSARLYNVINMPVPAPGEGLQIVRLMVKPHRIDDIPMVRLEGDIFNPTEQTQPLPLIEATAYDSDRRVAQRWSFPANKATIRAHETVSFRFVGETTFTSARELTLTFARE